MLWGIGGIILNVFRVTYPASHQREILGSVSAFLHLISSFPCALETGILIRTSQVRQPRLRSAKWAVPTTRGEVPTIEESAGFLPPWPQDTPRCRGTRRDLQDPTAQAPLGSRPRPLGPVAPPTPWTARLPIAARPSPVGPRPIPKDTPLPWRRPERASASDRVNTGSRREDGGRR